MNLPLLADRIREGRRHLGFSSAEMAEELGVSPAYYSRLESGKARPSRVKLDKIVKVLYPSAEDRRMMNELAGYTTSSDQVSGTDAHDLKTEHPRTYVPKYDPQASPILYSDVMSLTITENGVVIEFGQRAGAPETHVVARIGVSLYHAKKIQEVLKTELARVKQMGIDG